jgi:hypothetical protein
VKRGALSPALQIHWPLFSCHWPLLSRRSARQYAHPISARIRHPQSSFCPPPSAFCHPASGICDPPFVICDPPFVICDPPFVICDPPFVICHFSFPIPHSEFRIPHFSAEGVTHFPGPGKRGWPQRPPGEKLVLTVLGGTVSRRVFLLRAIQLARKGPPTLWHQRQFVQNPLSPVLDGRLVVKRKRKKPVHEGPAQMTRLHRKPLRPFGYRLLNEAGGRRHRICFNT